MISSFNQFSEISSSFELGALPKAIRFYQYNYLSMDVPLFAKWRSVDLNYPLKGWEQCDCVRKYLAEPATPREAAPKELNPVLEAIKDML